MGQFRWLKRHQRATISTGLVLLVAISAWTIFRSILPLRFLLTETPTERILSTPSLIPQITPTVTPTPTPTTAEAVTETRKINLARGKSDFRQGTLSANQTLDFVIPGQQGETLRIALQGDTSVLFTVLAPNYEPVNDRAKRVSFWEGELPFTGDYTVQLKTVRGLAKGEFSLNVSRQAPVTQPSPSPVPSPNMSPDDKVTLQVERAIVANETSKVITGRVNSRIVRRYLVAIQSGQVLRANLTPGSAVLKIYYPDGRLIEDMDNGVIAWAALMPRDGDYQIDVVAAQATDYQLKIDVSTPAQNSP